MKQNITNMVCTLWNNAITSKYYDPSELDIPSVSIKMLPQRMSFRDKNFQERSGLLLQFNNAALGDVPSAYYRTQVIDHREKGRPSLPYLAHHYARKLNLSKDTATFKALMLVAFRAEMDEYRHDKPAYHNPNHYADVFSTMANFLLLARERGTVFLSKHQESLGLIAAMGHDIKHPGVSNPQENPTQNEMISFQSIVGLLKYAGLDDHDIADIETLYTITSPNGPHAHLKNIKNQDKNKDGLKSFPQLQRLLDCPNLLEMAAMLSDADLFGGVGAGMNSQLCMSRLLTEEAKTAGQDLDFTKPEARMYFFDHIVGKDGLTSDIGRNVGNTSYMQMRTQTKAQLRL